MVHLRRHRVQGVEDVGQVERLEQERAAARLDQLLRVIGDVAGDEQRLGAQVRLVRDGDLEEHVAAHVRDAEVDEQRIEVLGGELRDRRLAALRGGGIEARAPERDLEITEQLIAARFLQTFGSIAAPVLARAIVRDLHEREAAARMLSLMGIVDGRMASTEVSDLDPQAVRARIAGLFADAAAAPIAAASARNT